MIERVAFFERAYKSRFVIASVEISAARSRYGKHIRPACKSSDGKGKISDFRRFKRAHRSKRSSADRSVRSRRTNELFDRGATVESLFSYRGNVVKRERFSVVLIKRSAGLERALAKRSNVFKTGYFI